MKAHTYAPPAVEVVHPGDGNKIIVGAWPDGETVALVLGEEAAKDVAAKLLETGIVVTDQLPTPPYLRGL